MWALQNDHVNQLDAVVNGEFNMLNVSQVLTASDSVLREMYKELNVDIMRIYFNNLILTGE
jgi:hypothetical protein